VNLSYLNGKQGNSPRMFRNAAINTLITTAKKAAGAAVRPSAARAKNTR
jgi:hypothetical protein